MTPYRAKSGSSIFIMSTYEVMFLSLFVLCVSSRIPEAVGKLNEIFWRAGMCDQQQMVRLWW